MDNVEEIKNIKKSLTEEFKEKNSLEKSISENKERLNELLLKQEKGSYFGKYFKVCSQNPNNSIVDYLYISGERFVIDTKDNLDKLLFFGTRILEIDGKVITIIKSKEKEIYFAWLDMFYHPNMERFIEISEDEFVKKMKSFVETYKK